MYNPSMSRTKTPDDIAAIEKVQRATEEAMRAVIAYLRTSPVPTAEDAHGIIARTLEPLGCESKDDIVAGGPASAEPHERGAGVLRSGEPIVIDIFPHSKESGFYADMSRTICIGEAPERLIEMHAAVNEAVTLATSLIEPGRPCIDIQSAVEGLFDARGFHTTGKGKEFRFAEGFVHGVGHGVGLEIHESPRLGRSSTDILQVGDVITIEPGLYYPDIGGVRIENLVAITESGTRTLTNFPTGLDA